MKDRINIALITIACMMLMSCASSNRSSLEGSEGPDFGKAYDNYYRLGVAYMQKGRFDLAEPKLKRAIEINSKPPDAWNALALLYEETRDIKSSNALYTKLIASNPEYSLGYMNYATFLCKFKRDDEKGKLYQMMRAKSGVFAALSYIAEGNCQMQRGNTDQAAANYRQALTYDNQSAGALLPLAEIEIGKKNYTAATQYLKVVHTYIGYSAKSVRLGILAARGVGDKVEEDNLMRVMRASYSNTEDARSLGL